MVFQVVSVLMLVLDRWLVGFCYDILSVFGAFLGLIVMFQVIARDGCMLNMGQ